MNTQHLRYFLAVMDAGSISRAAEGLGMTQPTLSVAMKRIEQEFGTRLFSPDGRGIRPLPEANLLAQRLRPLLQALVEVKNELRSEPPPAVKIGIAQSLSEQWTLRLVSSCGGRAEIVECLPGELEARIANETLNLALMPLPIRRKLRQKILFREPYKLFVGAAHAFAGRSRVSLDELNRQSFVLRQCCENLGSGRKLFDAANVSVKIVAKTRQESTAAALVSAGIGCTIAPESWLRPGIRAIDMIGFSMERAVGMVWKSAGYSKTVDKIGKQLAVL